MAEDTDASHDGTASSSSNVVDTQSVHNSSESEYSPTESGPESRLVNQDLETRIAEPNARTRGRHVNGHPNASNRKYRITKGYRDLVNLMIADVLPGEVVYDEQLLQSQVGGTFWTVSEKNRFFAELAVSGPDDTRTLARAVRTKSELEVRSYLLLLQEGLAEVSATATRNVGSQYQPPAAAYEVGPECEAALDSCAHELVKLAGRHDVKVARNKFGDEWLIDEAVAEFIERRLSTDVYAPDGLWQANGKQERIEPSDDRKKSPTLEPATRDIPERDKGSDSPLSDDAIGARDPTIQSPAFKLLRPHAFLQLSRCLFMNSAISSDHNWHDLLDGHEASSIDLTAPAIFRTAFDDFYNITLSLTRRLVQASIYQAMTRLRAKDDSHPVEAVREVDVRTAADILRLTPDKMSYWAKAARRCGAEVYAEPPRCGKRGRTAKHNALLTYSEVEAELGLPNELDRAPEDMHLDLDRVEDISDILDDSDNWTLASEDGLHSHDVLNNPELPSSDHESVDVSSPTKRPATDETEVSETDPPVPSSHKRRKMLDHWTAQRTEDAQLEAMDHRASLEEEVRLWEAVNQAQSAPEVDAIVDRPSQTVQKHPHFDVSSQWRTKTHYEAEWESHPDTFDHGIVTALNKRFELRSAARRRALAETMQDVQSPDSETNDVDWLNADQ